MQALGFHHFEEQASVKKHLTNDRSLCNKTFLKKWKWGKENYKTFYLTMWEGWRYGPHITTHYFLTTDAYENLNFAKKGN